MRKPLPPLNWLRSFEAAARHLSFTGAAVELNITQSAVSQQVKCLEHYLGQPMFLRKPRRLELTDGGRNFLRSVEDAFQSLRHGTAAFLGRNDEVALEVKANTAFSVLWLMPRIGDFLQRHPWVELDLSATFWPSEFATSHASVLIRYGRDDFEGAAGTPLAAQSMYPICAPQLLESLREPADLDGQVLLRINGIDDWDYWARGAGLPAPHGRGQHHLMTYVLTSSMAAQGLGVALGHDVVSGGQIASGELVAPFDIRVPMRDNYYLVTPRPKALNEAARVFCDWLLGEFGG